MLHLGGRSTRPLPYSLSSFDLVILSEVAEHLPTIVPLVPEIGRVLAPGGHLFITTPDASAPIAKLLGAHWYYIDVLEHVSLFPAATLTRLLDECGFRLLERRTLGRRYRVSYIERRLRQLARDSRVLRLLGAAAFPLRLATGARITVNFGDVMAMTAVAR